MRELSRTSNPRGAYIATSDDVSPGIVFTLVRWYVLRRRFRTTPALRSTRTRATEPAFPFGPFGAVFTTRNAETPPVPDSCGIPSAMRSSHAPTVKAALPLREQPVTPTAVGSMMLFRPAAFSATSTSMTRLIPQAQPT